MQGVDQADPGRHRLFRVETLAGAMVDWVTGSTKLPPAGDEQGDQNQ
jgi:hypothetical protein